MTERRRPAGQLTVPDDFRQTLRDLRRRKDSRLPMVLKVAHLNGWPLRALGDAVGVSHEWVRLLVRRANGAARDLPDVPLPPRESPPPLKAPQRQLRVNPDLADRLREMQRVVRSVNGSTPADAPERRVSVEYAAQLHALTLQGVSIYHLAKVIGVAQNAIRSRLARHGYREMPPSQAHQRYLGRPRGRATTTDLRDGKP